MSSIISNDYAILLNDIKQRMRLFYDTYCNEIKLAPLVREISWSKNIILMEKCKDVLEREFYIRMTQGDGFIERTGVGRGIRYMILQGR